MRPGPFLALAVALLGTGCYGRSEQWIVLGAEPSVPPEAVAPDMVSFKPPPFGLRRLQAPQYRRAVEDLLGPEAAAAASPPEDAAVNGFRAIGNAQLSLSTPMALRYEASATAAAEAALATPAQRAWLVGCDPSDECLRSFASRLGRRAFRRSLDAEEVDAWSAVGSEAAAALGDFWGGAGAVVAGMLQSPNFLYLVEAGAPDPERPGRWALTGPELASRMAFFLTGGPPPDALLGAAEAGELGSDQGRRRWAWRLALGDPRARAALRDFWSEHLGLDALATLAKDPVAYPEFSPALAAAMREETLAFADEVVWDQDLDARELLRARFTVASGAIADLYGIERPAGGFGRLALSAGGMRGGLLGQASFLALRAHEAQTSPTRRGLFVRERLLCETVDQPPGQVSTTLPPVEGAVTMRQRLAVHREDPVCAGCHGLMDDIGLGLESFDGIGRFRTLDQGVEIDPASELDGTPFAGAAELGEVLAADPRAMRCLQRNLFRAAVGHVETPGEALPMFHLEQAFAASGYRLRALLVEIAASEAFRAGAPPEVAP